MKKEHHGSGISRGKARAGRGIYIKEDVFAVGKFLVWDGLHVRMLFCEAFAHFGKYFN